MIFKFILLLFLSATFFSFYRRKLVTTIRPSFVVPTATMLTLISLAPFGWVIGLFGVYAIPKLIGPINQQPLVICAKCGTLSKKGDTTCRKCNNALN